jgi:hypothetical protein
MCFWTKEKERKIENKRGRRQVYELLLVLLKTKTIY